MYNIPDNNVSSGKPLLASDMSAVLHIGIGTIRRFGDGQKPDRRREDLLLWL